MIESRYSSQLRQNVSFLLLIKVSHKISQWLITFTTALILSACSTQPFVSQQPSVIQYSKETRLAYLQTLTSWQINGRIAFIGEKERNSASLFWTLNEHNATEQLNLTTFLGINVLSVNRKNNLYQVEVEDNIYKSQNVDDILLALTGYQLPANALKHWIKGITYSDNETIITDQNTLLPTSISSTYNDKLWQISYQAFTQVNGIDLPKRLTIKQDNFTIKLAISQWQI